MKCNLSFQYLSIQNGQTGRVFNIRILCVLSPWYSVCHPYIPCISIYPSPSCFSPMNIYSKAYRSIYFTVKGESLCTNGLFSGLSISKSNAIFLVRLFSEPNSTLKHPPHYRSSQQSVSKHQVCQRPNRKILHPSSLQNGSEKPTGT